MPYQVTIAHQTDRGREREENQDFIGYRCDGRSRTHLLIVADGLGGSACGRVASELAVQTIQRAFFSHRDPRLTINQRLNSSISEANRSILHHAEREPQCRGMGSTCAVLALTSESAHVAHAGDSRIYLIRDGRIKQLTRDHSRVQRMLDDGLITEEEAAVHPDRNWLDRALGLREGIAPEILPEPIQLRNRDNFVISSDGLTSLVRDEEIFTIVQHAPADQACAALITLANKRGGHDNITVAIAGISADAMANF